MAVNGVQNKGIMLQISVAAPQNVDLTEAQFKALTYIEICCPTELPEFGNETEILSEHCISGEEVVGIGAATGIETEVAYFYRDACAGQNFLRNNSKDNINSYAVRKIYPDGTPTKTASTIYSRVMLKAWNDGGGDVSGFITHTSSWKIMQSPIFVTPAPI